MRCCTNTRRKPDWLEILCNLCSPLVYEQHAPCTARTTTRVMRYAYVSKTPKSVKQALTCTRAYNTESIVVLRKTVLPTPPHSIRSFHTGGHACTAAEDVQNRQWPKKVAEVGQVLFRAALLVRQAQHLPTSCVKSNCSALYIHHGLKTQTNSRAKGSLHI